MRISSSGWSLPRYIPLISSRIGPSGSLKQTTPIVAPSGPLILFSGATHWTFFSCRFAYVRSISSTLKTMRQMPMLLGSGRACPAAAGRRLSTIFPS